MYTIQVFTLAFCNIPELYESQSVLDLAMGYLGLLHLVQHQLAATTKSSLSTLQVFQLINIKGDMS